MIACDFKNRNFWTKRPQTIQIIDIAVEYPPANAGKHSGFRYTDQPSGCQRLEENAIRPRFSGLYKIKQLRTLFNGIILCKNELDIRAKMACGLLGCFGLFLLIAIVIGKRDYEI